MSSVVRRPRGFRLLASFALVATLLPAAVTPVAAAEVLPGFRDELVWSGLQFPTAIAAAPGGGRIFVAEKRGTIQAFDGLDDPTATQVADFSNQVYDYWDRGFLGLTIDPQFPTRPYLYALYTYDSVPWNDTCPSPPGPTTHGCMAGGRLVRLTVGSGGAGVVTTTTNLIDGLVPAVPEPLHRHGGVRSGWRAVRVRWRRRELLACARLRSARLDGTRRADARQPVRRSGQPGRGPALPGHPFRRATPPASPGRSSA